jgi:uncharacterized protein (TIGR02452 family)
MMIAMHLLLIAQPWKTTIITTPAPNHCAIIMNHPSHEIEEMFKRQIDMILSIAVHFGRHHLVLGAWGCAVRLEMIRRMLHRCLGIDCSKLLSEELLIQ